ncbi:MAG: hypothetical protein PHP82_00515 [Candidatus ainarchaeum sp.]|nr:hypothetical protein [Candidatus ainarchaeum sp.]
MEIKFKDYSNSFENKLNILFFDSVFKKREEFEYVKEHSWIERYKYEKNSIQLLAINKNEIIASIGVLPIETRVNNKIYKGGCFVDNCVLDKYSKDIVKITFKMFNELEKVIIDKKFDFLIGWDYIKHKNNYSKLIKEKKYITKEGINWISGGFEYKKNNPKKWQAGKTILIEFILAKIYNRIKLNLIKKDKGIKVRFIKNSDYSKISNLIHQCYPKDFIINYNKKTFSNLLKKYVMSGIIIEKNGKIVAAAPFQIGSWSGWMYGNPSKTKDWEIFNTILPEIIAIDPKYKKTNIPKILSVALIKETQKNNLFSKTNGFVTDVFDTAISWRKKAHTDASYLEPKMDFGMFIAKSFNKKLKFTKNQIWHIPPRNIISPKLK